MLSVHGHRCDGGRSGAAHPFTMNDLLFIGLTVAFFAISVAYAHFCEAMR